VKSFKGIFKQFLSRDPDGCLSYGFDKNNTKLVEKCVSEITHKYCQDSRHRDKSLREKFDMAVEECSDIALKTDNISIINRRFFEIAVEATKIKLSLFTELFHQAFKKHKFLESTFELLQQFEIQMTMYNTEYYLFPGDMHEWQIICLRCNAKISNASFLNSTLTIVPISILHHLSLATYDTDSYYIPVLFSSHEKFIEVRDMFYEDGNDQNCPCCTKNRIHTDLTLTDEDNMRNCDELPESSLRAPIMSSHRSRVSELPVSFP
jgi:hypothetical protein